MPDSSDDAASFPQMTEISSKRNSSRKLKGMEGNRTLYGDVIAGPMYIVGEDTDGGFCGLTEKQVQKYKEMFAEPEDISPEEVEASIRFSFSPW